MKYELLILLTLQILITGTVLAPVKAQTGMGFGIPNSTPGAFWPRAFSIEQQSPSNLYPNGPQFGLSNTSGGLGTSGTGEMSGVGLEQRSVSLLVREEMCDLYSFGRQLRESFGRESLRGSSIFSTVLAGRFRSQMNSSAYPHYQMGNPGLITPYALPSVDSILHDNSANTDSILRSPSW